MSPDDVARNRNSLLQAMMIGATVNCLRIDGTMLRTPETTLWESNSPKRRVARPHAAIRPRSKRRSTATSGHLESIVAEVLKRNQRKNSGRPARTH